MRQKTYYTYKLKAKIHQCVGVNTGIRSDIMEELDIALMKSSLTANRQSKVSLLAKSQRMTRKPQRMISPRWR